MIITGNKVVVSSGKASIMMAMLQNTDRGLVDGVAEQDGEEEQIIVIYLLQYPRGAECEVQVAEVNKKYTRIYYYINLVL